MSLEVPQFNAPQFAAPVQNAYVWAGVLHIDFRDMSGNVLVIVNPDAASAGSGKPPLETFPVPMGQPVTHGGPVVLKSLSEWMADPVVGPAFLTIRTAIYASLPTHPRLAGATEVP